MVHKKPQPNSKGSSYLRLAAQLRGLGARLVVGVLSCTVSLACLVLQAQQEHFRTRSLQVTTPTTINTFITGQMVHKKQVVHTNLFHHRSQGAHRTDGAHQSKTKKKEGMPGQCQPRCVPCPGQSPPGRWSSPWPAPSNTASELDTSCCPASCLHQGEYTANKQCTYIARNYVKTDNGQIVEHKATAA